jgi:hypothetical protein
VKARKLLSGEEMLKGEEMHTDPQIKELKSH